jgi:Zn-dependent protease with chaperone function
MKKIIFLCIINILLHNLQGQEFLNLSGTVKSQISVVGLPISLEPDEKINVIGITKQDVSLLYLLERDKARLPIALKDIDKIEFTRQETVQQAWQLFALNSDIYKSLAENGYQYDLRNELDEESNEYLSMINNNDLCFDDAYLEDYLQSILYKIHPITLGDRRPGNLNIEIIKDPAPNAFCLPNGTIVVNTGLLSMIDSEEELTALLAHEIAHFVLDHYVVNYNAEIQRQNRAAFWAGIATAAAAVTEGYLAYKNPYYIPGGLTYSTAVISALLATSITERLGLKYSRLQESEADMASVNILEFLGIDPIALSSVLSKLEKYSIRVGDYYALSDQGSHPGLPTRIKAIGDLGDKKFYDSEYHKLISFVNTYNANEEYNLKHFIKCDELVQKNIESGVAVEDDYILKAMVTRALYDTPEKNMEALEYLQIAKSLSVVPNPFVFKQEGITYLRLNNNMEANNSFQRYLAELESIEDPSDYILNEIAWTKKMIHKSTKM